MTEVASAEAEAAQHLRGANPAVLCAALATITGDIDRARQFLPDLTHSWQTKVVIAAELPPDRREELDRWALEVLSDLEANQAGQAYAGDSSNMTDQAFCEFAGGLVGQMLGFSIAPQSARFLKEQAGFVDFVQPAGNTNPSGPQYGTLLIIGAGMSGIAAGIAAEKLGVPYLILEKGNDLGGIWATNRYPGIGVDTPGPYYSFSFEVNDRWSGAFPAGDEYLDYIHRVADKYGVTKNIVFGADVSELAWDEATAQWQVNYEVDGSEKQRSARFVMTASGYLTRTHLPEAPGLESFSGHWFHSARWDHDYDFSGKRLAVVGTGCTSVQIVDAMIDEVSSLTLIQRQPHWVMPPSPAKFDETELWLNKHVPEYARWSRLAVYLAIGDVGYPVTRYDEEWAAEHDLSISYANDMVLQVCMGHLQSSFAERPDLLERMTPNYAPFGKRIIRDPGGYYDALTRNKATVASGLSHVVPEGVVDEDGTLHEVDVIVYATGFHLDFLNLMDITGRDGAKLDERWGDSPVAYNGCMVPDFPNLFITSGPHANPSHGGGHNFMVEATVHYVFEAIKTLTEAGASTIEPTEAALDKWKAEVDAELADSIWIREKRATTYYRNARGEVLLASPFTMEEVWNRLRSPVLEDIAIGS